MPGTEVGYLLRGVLVLTSGMLLPGAICKNNTEIVERVGKDWIRMLFFDLPPPTVALLATDLVPASYYCCPTYYLLLLLASPYRILFCDLVRALFYCYSLPITATTPCGFPGNNSECGCTDSEDCGTDSAYGTR
eukprot:1907795-Rhodomonas_salina.4